VVERQVQTHEHVLLWLREIVERRQERVALFCGPKCITKTKNESTSELASQRINQSINQSINKDDARHLASRPSQASP
jgi:hypothetical protein